MKLITLWYHSNKILFEKKKKVYMSKSLKVLSIFVDLTGLYRQYCMSCVIAWQYPLFVRDDHQQFPFIFTTSLLNSITEEKNIKYCPLLSSIHQPYQMGGSRKNCFKGPAKFIYNIAINLLLFYLPIFLHFI